MATNSLNSTSLNTTAATSIDDAVFASVYQQPLIIGILTTLLILSIVAYVAIGYYFLSSSELRKSLHYHGVFVLCILNLLDLLTDFTLVINTLRTSLVSPTIPATCYIWVFISAYTYYGTLVHMTWVSIERHLLIFQDRWFKKKQVRVYLHYIPMIVIYGYTAVYYLYVVFLYPCKNDFDFSLTYCGNVCYMKLDNAVVYNIEILIHQLIPTIIIILANLLLIIRVIVSRQRLRQATDWSKYRNMVIQLVATATLALVFSTPFSLNPLAQLVGLPMPISYDLYLTAFSYWAYGMQLFLPFIIAFTYPNVVQKLKNLLISETR